MSIPEFAHRAILSFWLLSVMLKPICLMTISFIFLAVYIEFEKSLGNDDQNNVKHLHSVIKKKRKSVI